MPNTNKKVQRAYFFSEMAYDAHFFNSVAYENLLKFVEQDPDEIMIVVDGALTRLDRPEILNDLLTYWNKSESECRNISEVVKNYEQSQHMLRIQFEILDERMAELRKRLPNAEKHHLVLCVEGDDTQYTVSKLLQDLLIHRKAQIDMAIKVKVGEKKRMAEEYKKAKQKFEKDQPALKERKSRRESLNRQIEGLKRVEAQIVANKEELSLYREQKIRPTHQFVTATLIESIIQAYRKICKKYNIKFIDRPARLLKFGKTAGDFVIKYAHNGHKTHVPTLARHEAFTHSVVEKVIGDVEAERVDAHVEGGHSGIGYSTTQKTKDDPAETNFQGQADYDPTIAPLENYAKICMAIPFEDQELIAKFMENEEQTRMSFGKPIGSRSHEVFRRFSNGSVSGMFMLTRCEDGLLVPRYIQYKNFLDGSVLKQPKRYWAIWATSDEHIGSPEENPTVRDGFQKLFEEHSKKPFNFHGKPVHLGGYISGGDTGEPPLVAWNRRYDNRRSPTKLLVENIEKLVRLDTSNAEAVLALAVQLVSDTMDGQSHSVEVMMARVAEYYLYFLDILLSIKSALKFLVVVTKGNHGDGPLRPNGQGEDHDFKVILAERKIGALVVGLSAHYPKSPNTVRVGLGGHSDARNINIPDYGLDVNGEALFGPVNLLVHHDPQGSGFSGMIGAARKVGANNVLAGHTHVNGIKLFRNGLNQFSVAQRLSTVTGVTVTEKYYASSLPRTQAAHWMIMFGPGDYAEKTLPAAYLRKVGQKTNLQKVVVGIAAVPKN